MMGRIPYTNAMLATIFRMKESTVSMALDVFANFEMVEIVEGVITIPNWKKHQSLDAYEKKKERDRLYQAERRAAQRALIQKSSDTSSDIASLEEEREEDEEKDNSFNHSCDFEDDFSDSSTDFSTRAEAQRRYLGGELGKGVVLLSQEQMDDLLEKLTVDEFDHYVSVVADCILKGKRYTKKTHYQAILDMAAKDRKVK